MKIALFFSLCSETNPKSVKDLNVKTVFELLQKRETLQDIGTGNVYRQGHKDTGNKGKTTKCDHIKLRHYERNKTQRSHKSYI